MTKRIFLLLLALPLLLAGCEEDSPVNPPIVMPDIPEGTIPVVFHVLYESPSNSTQSPDPSVFTQRIEQLNKFYAATLFTNTAMPGVPSQSVGVKFVLATHNPDGTVLAEPGIDRVYYAGAADMSAANFLSTKRTLPTKDKAILWDPNQFVNIWLFGFLKSTNPELNESNVTGISYLPYCTSTNPLSLLVEWNGALTESPYYMHGIVLNNNYFSPKKDIDPSNQQSLLDDEGMFTLCHEMGHYLGLRHAFNEPENGKVYDGCANPDNASDDGCEDTPKYDRVAYMATIQPALDGDIPVDQLPYPPYYRQPCDNGPLTLSTNVMDYYFGFRTNLTTQQKDRVEHVVAYSPWIPRNKTKTKALLDNFTGEITDERPEPILMY